MEEYEKIICFESLYAAHKKARCSKQNRDEVIRHLMHGHTYHLRQRIWSDLVLTRAGNIQNPENESVQSGERTGGFKLEKRGK